MRPCSISEQARFAKSERRWAAVRFSLVVLRRCLIGCGPFLELVVEVLGDQIGEADRSFFFHSEARSADRRHGAGEQRGIERHAEAEAELGKLVLDLVE